MVKITNLVKRYGDFCLDVSMEISNGMITGIIGKNGVEQVIELPLTDEEKAKFHACCEGVRKNMEHLKEI